MNKIIIIIFFFISYVSFGQTYPITQNLGSPTTLVTNNGGQRMSGAFILGHFTDTTAANAVSYVKNYANNLITTDTNRVWIRNYNATKWVLVASSGGAIKSVSLSMPSGFNVNNSNINGDVFLLVTGAGDTTQVIRGDGSLGSFNGIGWGLKGNAGTTAGTNFLGTTDSQPFIIKQNSVQVAAFGYQSLYVGGQVGTPGYVSTEGIYFGGQTAYQFDTSAKNAYFTLYGATGNHTGSRNVAVGVHTFESNVEGSDNGAFGPSTMRWNRDGIQNTAVGNQSGYLWSTVVDSVAMVNHGSGYTTATVTFSAPLGSVIPGTPSVTATGTAVIVGGQINRITIANPGNNYEVWYGPFLPVVTITGDGTGATGTVILKSASFNSAIGSGSLAYLESGWYNSAIGYLAGYGAGGTEASLKDQKNTFIGSFSGRDGSLPRLTELDSSIALGYNAKVACNDCGVFGTSKTKIGIHTTTPRAPLDVADSALINDMTIKRGGGAAKSMGIGTGSLGNVTSGQANTAIGESSQATLTAGLQNTSLGYHSLQFVDFGGNNTALGSQALVNNTGDDNTAVGVEAMKLNTISIRNLAFGSYALTNHYKNNNNIGIGYTALQNDTTGTANLAIGNGSMSASVSSSDNVGVGANTLVVNKTGIRNTAIGQLALGATTGSNNIALGYNAGVGHTTGSNNVYLGSYSGNTFAAKSAWSIFSDGAGTIKYVIDSAGNIGIGTNTPAYILHIVNTGAALLPKGNTAQRPTAIAGLIRYNTDSTAYEYYDGSAWNKFGSGGGGGSATTIYNGDGSLGTDRIVTAADFRTTWTSTTQSASTFTLNNTRTDAVGTTTLDVFGSNGNAGDRQYGLKSTITNSGGSATNVAAQFTAVNGGTANYAILVPSGGGNVGIWNTSPTVTFTVGNGTLTGTPTPKRSLVSFDTSASSGTMLVSLVRANQTAANSGSIQALEGYTRVSNATGTVALGLATIGNTEMTGAGTLTSARGVQGGTFINGSGTVTNMSSIFAASPTIINGTTGTITNAYGIYVDSSDPGSAGTITNETGIYINSRSGKTGLNIPRSKVVFGGLTSSANAGDSIMVVNTSNGNVGYRAIPSSGGTIGGSIAANQIAVGTGSNTIGGSSSLTWDGSMISILGSGSAGPVKVGNINADFLITNNFGSTYFRFLPFGGDIYFGNSDNGALIFRNNEATSSAELMRVSAGGNLGIGTNSPTSMLSVGSASNFQVTSAGKIAKYNNSSITDGQILIGHTSNGTFEKATITAGTGISVTNGAGSVTIATSGYSAGTYTPTVTAVTNTSAVTAGLFHYIVSGSEVSFSGYVNFTTTAAVASEIGISLPVASAFGNANDAAGVGNATSAVATNGYVQADATNDRLSLKFLGLSISGTGSIYVSGHYTIILP